MTHPLREYGYGASDQFVRGAPRVVGLSTMPLPCPGCKCRTLYDIEVEVAHPLLRGGRGVGHYVGCPACPFASPMLMQAVEMTPAETKP